MRSDDHRDERAEPPRDEIGRLVAVLAPKPTIQFRLRAWRDYQRALDPLAPPRPLRPRRRAGG